MTPIELARLLHSARRDAMPVAVDDAAVGDVATAHAVQIELARLDGSEVRGWKVTALNPADRAKYRSETAVAGPLFRSRMPPRGQPIRISDFIVPLIECEIAFVLGADLPARPAGRPVEEVEAAIAAVVPAIEIPDCRLAGTPSDLLKLADDMGNGAFLIGEPIADWRSLDLGDLAVTLESDDRLPVAGRSTRIGCHPVAALRALADAGALPAGGLRKGQMVTTGSCIDPVPARAGTFVGRFGPLGDLAVTFTP